MLERFDDRSALNNFRLRECYIEGEIHIIVHRGFPYSYYVAIFQRFSEVRKGYVTNSFVVTVPITGNCKTGSCNVDKRSEQGMMLVCNIQIVENPESCALPP